MSFRLILFLPERGHFCPQRHVFQRCNNFEKKITFFKRRFFALRAQADKSVCAPF